MNKQWYLKIIQQRDTHTYLINNKKKKKKKTNKNTNQAYALIENIMKINF